LLSYAGKIMLPLNLSVLPLAKDISLHYGAAGLALLAGLSLVGGLRDGKAFGFGAAWFLVFLLPTFIPSAGAINFLEHRLYLPLFGIMLALAQNRGLRRVSAVPGTALVLLLAAVLGVMSFRHSRAFADGTAFWSNAARTSPRSALAHQMLGRQHFRAGRINEAARRYRLSLSLEQSPSAHNDLALACLKQGDLGSAEISFRRVLKMDSSFANVHNNLALIYFQRGQWPPARRHLAEAEKLSPLDPEPPLNIGVLMLELGHPDSAELFLRKALDLDPQNPGALLNLGITLSLQGRRAEALNFLRAAHRCRPDHPLVNLRLAQLYLLLGQAGPAQEHYRAARKAGGPADPRLEK
jgi:Flp pilus assembly protein TadD